MADRCSVRRTQLGTLDSVRLQYAMELRHGAGPSTAVPAPNCPASIGSVLHGGQEPDPPRAGAVAKSGRQTTGSTLRAEDA